MGRGSVIILSKIFRVIIAGGRDFNNYEFAKNKINYVLQNKMNNDTNLIIICGGACGADKIGERFAKENGIEIQYYLANWSTFGKSAGYIRNKQMADNADALIAFWDGKSSGTKHMIDLAKKYGLKTRIFYY